MKRILILAANPRQDLNLRKEIHILKSVIERSQAQDEFEVKIGSGVSSDEIQRLFLEHQPRIVHFCGHGAGEQGLVFEGDVTTETLVSNEALSDLFNIFANQVECVLLNACYSDIQATTISHHINYVIGMKQAIRDDAVIVFSRGFYEALGYGKFIEDAYNLGCNAIKIQLGNLDDSSSDTSDTDRKFINRKLVSQSLPEHLKPQLKIKSTLTPFPDEEELTSSKTLPDVTELVEDEINRKKYRKDLEDNFNLGRYNVNRGQPLTQQEYRWRQVLLSKVKESWIKGVLEKSLFTQVLFEQEITHRPDAVERPFSGFEEFAIESEKSFEFIQASDIFEGMGAGRTLLILGEPGTGKTLSMLKLAELLIKKTEENLSLPIPIIFNLSSWSIKRQNIADWLVEELKDKYQVSKVLGKRWIEQEELILLLDGLDEVKANYRNDCVRALNQFLDDHGITETVVCCRVKDYEALSERLKLRNAICIQPLSSEYINWYLEDVGKPLLGLKQLLQKDKDLEEFAKTPLIFSVMSITYEGYSLEDILEQINSRVPFYENLFNNYIKLMFRRRNRSKLISEKQSKKWLSWLAQKMTEGSNTVFFIEQLQPRFLQYKIQKIIDYLVSTLIGGIIVGLSITILFTSISYLSGGLAFGLIFGSISGFLIGNIKNIKTIETLQWSGQEVKNVIFSRNFILALLLLPVGGLLFLPIFVLVFGLRGPAIEKKNFPNQGIFKTVQNSIILGSSSGLFFLLLFWLMSGKFMVGLFFFLMLGLVGGLIGGGAACIRHFTLRIVCYFNGYIPWNYAKFLDYATERLFMQKVGGGYIFIHRMLMEHFANMKLD